jgi:4-hydroxybenzoate polyprenyltransferase
MTGFLRLIRIPNLIIIALTMLAVRYGIVQTLWERAAYDFLQAGFYPQNFKLHFGRFHFGLLVISTLCIAAAGYIINDYFDTKTDHINKPDRVVVGREISRGRAILLHMVLSGIGLALAAWVCWDIRQMKLLLFQILSIGALWAYSAWLKKQMLAGNILIALLAALVPVMTGIFEFQGGTLTSLEIMNLNVPESGSAMLKQGAILVLGYALFAFLSNLIREIVKDLEDVEGDIELGCKTLPIVAGEVQARYIAMAITVFTGILLGLIIQVLFSAHMTGMAIYLIAAVMLPLLLITILLWNAWEKRHYTRISWLVKLIIVTGIGSMPVFALTTL